MISTIETKAFLLLETSTKLLFCEKTLGKGPVVENNCGIGAGIETSDGAKGAHLKVLNLTFFSATVTFLLQAQNTFPDHCLRGKGRRQGVVGLGVLVGKGKGGNEGENRRITRERRIRGEETRQRKASPCFARPSGVLYCTLLYSCTVSPQCERAHMS